jgi:ERCC4-type nuclease
MLIKIDCREKELFEECLKQQINVISIGTNKSEDKIINENLPLGDIIICDDNGIEKVIIERKTLKDLAASIRDGRYAEQGFRLQQCSMHNHNIFYLIEGDIKYYRPFKNNIDKKALLSAMVSITYFKGFSLYKTNSIVETAEWIIQFAKKLQKEFLVSTSNISFYERIAIEKVSDNNIINIVNENNIENYSKVVVNKRIKKDNITPENIGEIMLAQIPGVSNAIAVAIMKKYGTIKNLIEHISDEAKKDLHNIEICSEKSEKGKSRKINKTCIANIYKFLIENNASPNNAAPNNEIKSI